MADLLNVVLLCDKCGRDLSGLRDLFGACPLAGCEVVAAGVRCLGCGNLLGMVFTWGPEEFVVVGRGFREGEACA